MARVYNFSAGPAVLPEEVLMEAAAEMLDYNGTGMGVMEMSHRSKAYQQIIDEAEADLRELMNIPEPLTPRLILALGKPCETVVLEDAKDGKLTYYRDDQNVHHVPKLSVEDMIL